MSLVVMSILLGSMASAVILAGHALPDSGDPSERMASAVECVDRITRDLVLAEAITLAEPHEIRFEVPDRGHDPAGPEKIIFAWSGTAGDPLTTTYNSGPEVTLCADVHEFSLEYTRCSGTLTTAPRIALVAGSTSPASAGDTARQALMESWGFTVQMVASTEPQVVLDDWFADADVIYLSATIDAGDLATMDFNPGLGVITESVDLYDDLGLSFGAQATIGNDSIWVVDDTHEITSGLGTGTVPVFEYVQQQGYTTGELAPGARILSQWPGYEPSTVVVETGEALYGGASANGRRVGLCWGDAAFDVTALTREGRRYLRRAIVWAAAPADFGTVGIELQVGSDPVARIETEVQLLNAPQEQ
jgi:hypothetical protein